MLHGILAVIIERPLEAAVGRQVRVLTKTCSGFFRKKRSGGIAHREIPRALVPILGITTPFAKMNRGVQAGRLIGHDVGVARDGIVRSVPQRDPKCRIGTLRRDESADPCIIGCRVGLFHEFRIIQIHRLIRVLGESFSELICEILRCEFRVVREPLHTAGEERHQLRCGAEIGGAYHQGRRHIGSVMFPRMQSDKKGGMVRRADQKSRHRG